jgi:hypothetical protein
MKRRKARDNCFRLPSREAAQECSPRRKPWVGVQEPTSPEGRQRQNLETPARWFDALRAEQHMQRDVGRCMRQNLSPRWGSPSLVSDPRLTPWAAFLRRFAASPCANRISDQSARRVARPGGFLDRIPQLINRPMDLLERDHCRGGNQQMIARDAIYRTLHGINQ